MELVYAAVILLAGIVAMDTTSGPQMLVSEPVVSCTVLGFIFDMPAEGVLLGIMLQFFWFGYLPLGAARLLDGNMASYIATASLMSAAHELGHTGNLLMATYVPALLFSVLVGYIGERMTVAVRRMNGRRSEALMRRIEQEPVQSLALWHLSGNALSFARGAVMAAALIPAGVVMCGIIRFLPDVIVDGLAVSMLFIWGAISATAVMFFWLKGRQRYLATGALGGLLWIVTVALSGG